MLQLPQGNLGATISTCETHPMIRDVYKQDDFQVLICLAWSRQAR